MRKSGLILLLALLALALTASAQFPGFGRRSEDSSSEKKEQQRAPQFSPEEFRARQQEFLTEKSGLTKDEAEKFFPIYFELQQKKNEINANARQTVNNSRENGHLTDEDYTKLIDNLADAKVKTAELEKQYLEKFKKIVPAGKLLRIQIAETQFGSELIKEMQRPAQRMIGNSFFPGAMGSRPLVPFGIPGNGMSVPSHPWPAMPGQAVRPGQTAPQSPTK